MPFSPTDIAGLSLWLKADQIIGLSDGDPVGTWSDQSGNGNDATAAGLARPTYKTGILNSLPVVRFDGNVNRMIAAAACGGAHTVLIVAITQGAGSSSSPFGYTPEVMYSSSTPADYGGPHFIKADRTGASYPHNPTGGSYDGLGTYTYGQPYYWSLAFSLGSWSLRRNAIVEGSGTAASYQSAVDSLQFGAQTFPGGSPAPRNWLGDIAEVVIYNSKLSPGDLATVEAYLAGKWGMGTPVVAADRTVIGAGTTGNTVHLTSTNLVLTPGTPGSPVFTISTTGSGAAIAAQTVTDITHATLTITAGTAGTITISDAVSGASCTITVGNVKAWDAAGIFNTPSGGYGIAGTSIRWADTGVGSKFDFTGTSLSLLLDTNALSVAGVSAGAYPAINWSIDGLIWTRSVVPTSGRYPVMSIAAALADATHTVEVRHEPIDGGTLNASILNLGWLLDAGKVVSTPTGNAAVVSKRAAVLGDSITWGSAATNKARQSYGILLGAALGAEVVVIGKPGQGWEHNASDGSGTFPTTWNSYDGSHARTFASFDFLIVCQGTNDATLTASTVTSWLVAARAALGSTCKIVILLPFRNQVNAQMTSGFNTYTAAHPSDTAVYLIPQRMLGSTLQFTTDAFHPTDEGHALAAAMDAADIQAAIGGSGGGSTVFGPGVFEVRRVG